MEAFSRERGTTMRSGSRLAGSALLASVAGLLYAGCGSSNHSGAGDAGAGDTGIGDVTLGDSPSFGGDAASCTTSADCVAGLSCIGGVCCSDAAHVCSGTCCTGSSVCFFDQCVTPGLPCGTSSQCPQGQYCEPALGTPPDGGAAGGDAMVSDAMAGDGGVCTSLAVDGRCLPIPPTCPGDAGVELDGAACLEQCQYHPPPGGMLHPVQEWSWGTTAAASDPVDVWSTPTIGRIYDTNCDGQVNSDDSPVLVFVSGNVGGQNCQYTSCQNGVLRMVNGTTGQDIWSLSKASASSTGFMGFSIAIGDVVGDGTIQIVAMTGEGYIVIIDRNGNVLRTSDKPYTHVVSTTGWGGGIAIADMDLDGFPEIAYGDTVWTTKAGGLTRSWVGGAGTGGGSTQEISTIADLDLAPDGHLELLAGNTCYKDDGTILWQNTTLPDGFPGVADFNKDGKPDAVLVGNGTVWILEGATGTVELTGTLAGTGSGGPPTVADFDADGMPEIGVAMATYYSVMKPNYTAGTLDLLWKMQNHDLSSSVTGSTVFDFEGAGIPSVVYADECFLWVFDGPTGAVRFATPHTSFTATEASLVADIDGAGHANLVMVSNGADPSSAGWACEDANGNPETINGIPWVPGPASNKGYRGLVLFGDSADSWVGTRTLWSEHTYHVTNICDDTDNACPAPDKYGSIPSPETMNWTLPWLNDFRQNVQDVGIFNAPDAVVALSVSCTSPPVAQVSIRNIGQAGLPVGVEADVYQTGTAAKVGSVLTTYALLPGQTQTLSVSLSAPASPNGTFTAQIYDDPTNPKFHECNTSNDSSNPVTPNCVQ
jgi:hypothetical protein